MGEIWRRKKKMNLEFGAFLVFLADFGIIAHLLSTWSDVVHFIWAFSFEYRGKWMHWVPFFFVPVQIYALKNSWQKFRHRFCPTRDTAFKRSSVSSSFSAFFFNQLEQCLKKICYHGKPFCKCFHSSLFFPQISTWNIPLFNPIVIHDTERTVFNAIFPECGIARALLMECKH